MCITSYFSYNKYVKYFVIKENVTLLLIPFIYLNNKLMEQHVLDTNAEKQLS